MSRTRYKFYPSENGFSFCTSTIINWLALLGNPNIVQFALDSLGFLIEHNRIRLHGFVIMPDHLHIVGSSENMGKEFSDFRSFTARQTVNYLKVKKYFSTLALLVREFFR